MVHSNHNKIMIISKVILKVLLIQIHQQILQELQLNKIIIIQVQQHKIIQHKIIQQKILQHSLQTIVILQVLLLRGNLHQVHHRSNLQVLQVQVKRRLPQLHPQHLKKILQQQKPQLHHSQEFLQIQHVLKLKS